ncbi:hypothetical protein TVAG_247510 [Trichomonas vaginalis G3]|uniref:COMM domain-containing protein n=1 Tax=Trichomonas vaginalis (strain ATCC PRA-98 / G3) TaxID=412133 RepID=A2DKT9_TRIV3|nr:COMM domain family [Trichomonas vaginalis G3]EAY19072.1 hypothetical protein TVAG_247510 [Trichomonas vaginalis G3]KAI5521123.1 COMM domain family [Trichomonas vaginalis G3]|eukprot:XP_001580058.1 hypothetical protein [Trichomonas vaginalis G3]
MSDIEALKSQLSLVDQATDNATSSLSQRTNYIGLDWEIGMGVSASSGDTNPDPFISLKFKGVNNNGNIEEHLVRLTPQQFSEFAQSVSRMQKSISSYN